MLTTENKRMIQDSLRCLAATQAAAVAQIEEMMGVLVLVLDLDVSEEGGPGASIRPLVSEATFSVIWRGRTCFLGNTLLFRMFARLARSTNQYVAQLGVFAPIVQPQMFFTAQGILQERNRRFTDDELIDRLKALAVLSGIG